MKKYLLLPCLLVPLQFHTPAPIITDADLHCLALNAYHEARGESIKGIKLVTKSVINRYRKWNYPSICATIFAPKQYSWTSDKKKLKAVPYHHLIPIVKQGIYYKSNVTHYHTKQVYPSWAPKLKQQYAVGNHIFYSCTKTC